MAKKPNGNASKELTTEEDNRNYFTDYGKAAGGQSNIVGKLLRFTKGDYVAGQDNEDIDADTRVVVNMNSILVGWIRWEDNRPAEQLMGPVSEGFQPAPRSELGHDDKNRWEQDDKGTPRDPWQFSNLALMRSEGKKGELYTFTSASKGGIGAVGRLCTAYGNEMRERSDEFPIITLGIDSYVHSNKAFGRIKFPVFNIVGWANKSVFDDVEPAEDKPVKGKQKQLSSRRAA